MIFLVAFFFVAFGSDNKFGQILTSLKDVLHSTIQRKYINSQEDTEAPPVFKSIHENVRCQDAPIFRGKVKGASECQNHCAVNVDCNYYAFWKVRKFCETYATCNILEQDGNNIITVYKQLSGCDLVFDSYVAGVQAGFQPGVVTWGKNLWCKCITNKWIICGIFVIEGSATESIIRQRIDPKQLSEDALLPFVEVTPVLGTGMGNIVYIAPEKREEFLDPLTARPPIGAEIQILKTSHCLDVKRCTEGTAEMRLWGTAKGWCPMNKEPFRAGDPIYMLKSQIPDIMAEKLVPCLSASGMRTWSLLNSGIPFSDPFARQLSRKLVINDDYVLFWLFDDEMFANGMCSGEEQSKEVTFSKGEEQTKKARKRRGKRSGGPSDGKSPSSGEPSTPGSGEPSTSGAGPSTSSDYGFVEATDVAVDPSTTDAEPSPLVPVEENASDPQVKIGPSDTSGGLRLLEKGILTSAQNAEGDRSANSGSVSDFGPSSDPGPSSDNPAPSSGLAGSSSARSSPIKPKMTKERKKALLKQKIVPSSFLGSDEEAEFEGRKPEVPEWETVKSKREGKSAAKKAVQDLPMNYGDAKKAGELTEPKPDIPLMKKNYVSANQPNLEALKLDDPPLPKSEQNPAGPLEPNVQQFFDMAAQAISPTSPLEQASRGVQANPDTSESSAMARPDTSESSILARPTVSDRATSTRTSTRDQSVMTDPRDLKAEYEAPQTGRSKIRQTWRKQTLDALDPESEVSSINEASNNSFFISFIFAVAIFFYIFIFNIFYHFSHSDQDIYIEMEEHETHIHF